MDVILEYRRRPSTIATMLRALRPSPGLDKSEAYRQLAAHWRAHRIADGHVDAFCAMTGLPTEGPLPLLYPQVLIFPLQMALLTHPVFPVPIWRTLQIRNHLLQHGPLTRGETVELCVRVHAARVLERGVEFDFHATLATAAGVAWEALNTFYTRGRFGSPGAASPWAATPRGDPALLARWPLPRGERLRFSRLTGDYNGIHLAGCYARLMGFGDALLHPQRVLGQAMARLPDAAAEFPRRLDAWLKGPLYYGGQASLHGNWGAGGGTFAVFGEDPERPALVGRLQQPAAGAAPWS